jgi:hypothetical protein
MTFGDDDLWFGDDDWEPLWLVPAREARDVARDDQIAAALRDLVDELIPPLQAVEAALRRRGSFAKARQVRRVLAWMEDAAFIVIVDNLT